MPDVVDSTSDLGTAAVELALAIGQLVRRLRSETDEGRLNLSRVATLVRLDRNGWMTTADLARSEVMRPQSMGTILASLEKQGLVHRRPHLTDGRLVEFGLTEAGAAARRERSDAKREWLVAEIGKLDGSEQETLMNATAIIRRLGGG